MLEHLEQQKRLTGNQWRIIATANLGDMLDFFDFFLIGYVLAFIIGSWKLTFGQSAMILLASGLGAVPGRILLGLDGRQDRPPQGVHGHRAERGDRHRHHGHDARIRMPSFPAGCSWRSSASSSASAMPA